ncbi:MAG: PucR family transcriptional regulator ligand-binding domain-containing protein [Nocardioides sp.]|uniref:helix-turn-helix domain-containing protein n=1 Tax=Nocardioides sp. TaxID=35761 RepID=UPI0039E5C13E
MPTAPALPLTELLSLPALAQARVAAGAAGLGRAVVSVAVLDEPRAATVRRSGELVLTSGYPLVAGVPEDDSAPSLATLIRTLHQHGRAGLALSLGRYLDRFDSEAIAAADELDFPLLALPGDLSLDELVGQAYGRLRHAHVDSLARADSLHTTLSRLVLSGADIDRIATEVAEALGVEVLVTTTDGRESGGTLGGRESRETDDREVPGRQPSRPETHAGRGDADRADAERARLAATGLTDETGRIRVERMSPSCAYGDGGEARVLAIPAGGTDLARLVCLSPGRRLGHDDVQALERTAIVMALLLTRQRSVTLIENKYRGDFLRDVFLGRAGESTFVREHARTVGWDLDRPAVVICAEVDPLGPEEPAVDATTQRSWQERFAAAWRQVCTARDSSIPTVDFSTEVVSLLPAPRAPAELRAQVDQLITAVAGDRGGGRRPFSVGISRVAPSVQDLPAAYDQARRATRIGRRLVGGKATTWFDDLGVHRLIALVPDLAEVRAFVADVLGPLAEDSGEAGDLRTTLQVLLDTNLNVAEAARQQFFHYNTMRYRITKLESILGPFTTDPALRLDIAVALQALELRHQP